VWGEGGGGGEKRRKDEGYRPGCILTVTVADVEGRETNERNQENKKEREQETKRN
jgi:hypothetical protein